MIVDKVVLITGCGGGIGKSLTKAFYTYGFRVYASSRSLDSINDLKEIGINTLRMDVKDRLSIERAVNEVIEKEGKIDILINNAGVSSFNTWIDIPDEELEDVIQTNFLGAVRTTKEVAKHMIKERTGLIINIGSVAGFLPMPISGLYCASKASLHSFNDSLRVELSPFSIKVMLVMPGPIKTDIINKSLPNFKEILSNPESPYYPIHKELLDRPLTSIKNQVPVEGFTDSLMKSIFSSRIPNHFKYGPGSKFGLVFLSWLPTRLIDFIFSKKFGFSKLKSIIQKNGQNKKDN
ncbi:hypothetical protein RB653_008877 [Dictyostelium firmibasis]|uniref:Short-chain dehydrogenase n=1 Tax=Dictyostelium firmibasis TaxID=79012 RepID=A0AAN7UDA8_9MYCE